MLQVRDSSKIRIEKMNLWNIEIWVEDIHRTHMLLRICTIFKNTSLAHKIHKPKFKSYIVIKSSRMTDLEKGMKRVGSSQDIQTIYSKTKSKARDKH